VTDLDRIHKLRVALRMAANTFKRYEQIHLNKGTPDGKTKARENSEQAAYLEKVLKETETLPAGGGATGGVVHLPLRRVGE
jgi:hypothetical protein